MIKLNPNYLMWGTRALPNFLWPLKWFILKKSLKACGKNFRFSPNSIFSDHRLIEIGDNVFFGERTIINTEVPVKIGNHVMFGPDVMIMGGDHNISEAGIQMRYVKTGGKNIPVVLEDDVWIGARVLILKGVKIGEGSIVGAGSLVTKEMPPYTICLGNPCKPVKQRFSDVDLKTHLAKVNSVYSFEEVKMMYLKSISLSN
jgi:acetyltransferase-like isoleucine patch superfamily enzyme